MADAAPSEDIAASQSAAEGAPAVDPVEVTFEEAKEPAAAGGRTLKVCVASWNVGNKPPPEEGLAPWLPPTAECAEFDLIVVGVQESRYTPRDDDETAAAIERTPRRSRSRSVGTTFLSQHFLQVLQLHVGLEFQQVAVETLMEMRLVVFARNDLCEGLTDDNQLLAHFHVEARNEATGVGGVIGNKGGLLIKMEVLGTQLCFVSCHLAAHQDEQYLLQRNSDCQEIMAGTRVGLRMADLSQFDHVWWFGDLNYRVDLPSADGRERSHEEHVEEVLGLIERQDWATLQAADQLAAQIRGGKCLQGFQEAGPLEFAPTFKVMRQAGTHYKAQRVPSWCDRVLHRSLPDKAQHVRCTHYAGVPEVASSDHKPVVAHFEVDVPAPVSLTDHVLPEAPVITVQNLRAEGLTPMDLNGLSDPYVIFGAAPPALFGTGRKQTARMDKTLDPVWEKPYTLRPKVARGRDLAGCHLVLTVVDYDWGNPDDPMGAAVVSLRAAAEHQGHPQPFELPVIHNGVAAGTISGEILIANTHLAHAQSAHHVGDMGCGCVVC